MTSRSGFWDAHACLPLTANGSLRELASHRQAGCRVVGVNAGFDGMSPEATISALSKFAGELAQAEQGCEDAVVVLDAVAVLRDGENRDGLGVYFDIEGAQVLGGDVRVLDRLARLGLRSLVPVYNRANSAGGGCHDQTDSGLTPFGRELIRRQNELGIIVDASHCSVRTSLDMCSMSAKPVIFSHSNCRALVDHPRNVSDEQMRAAAATGGVIGINGSSLFLGSGDWPAAICEHVLHAIGVVGVEHVGVGLDYVYDVDDLANLVADAPGLFPEDHGTYDEVTFCPPEGWPIVEGLLLQAGLDRDAIEQVRWVNFARVAGETWIAQ